MLPVTRCNIPAHLYIFSLLEVNCLAFRLTTYTFTVLFQFFNIDFKLTKDRYCFWRLYEFWVLHIANAY